ncbi:MAG: hypothetical protein PHE27_07365 [Alphaproteobacteria bacterium]|nr:hypothetical protein [Alphaproteobacteria bacterium]
MEPVAYRVSEFCQIYVISKASFYREVQAGRLHILKRGRRSLVERTEAERWFGGFKTTAQNEAASTITKAPEATTRELLARLGRGSKT